MFKGHRFIKLINDNWVLDINEFRAYKVEIDSNGNIKNRALAFTVSIEDDGDINFEKYISVPIKVLKEAHNLIEDLIEDM